MHANKHSIENKGVRGVHLEKHHHPSCCLGVIPERATWRQKESERVERFDDSFLRASAVFSFSFFFFRDLFSPPLSHLSLSLFHPE